MSGARVIAVVGPTAAGKSDLGVAIAAAVGGAVVNADSMQLYRGMDVGTAKLGPDERRDVPHYLLDIWEITAAASVADYQLRTRACVDELLAAGVTPVVVGGSGLYVRAVLDDLRFPGTDPEVRARLEAELASHGAAALHARLAVRDARAAAAILPTNGRRVVRALEVVELTGRPFQAALPDHRDAYENTLHLGLDLPRPVLDERINQRVDRMWARGLVDEVRGLELRGLRTGRTASRALGYRQVLRFLAGESTEEQARDETIRATRRFARRQDSWFRRDSRVRWLPANRPDLTELATGLVLSTGMR